MAPGRGTVFAEFSLDEETIANIRRQTAQGEKHLPEFFVEVKDEAGLVVARVHRQLYVRLKPPARPESKS